MKPHYRIDKLYANGAMIAIRMQITDINTLTT